MDSDATKVFANRRQNAGYFGTLDYVVEFANETHFENLSEYVVGKIGDANSSTVPLYGLVDSLEGMVQRI